MSNVPRSVSIPPQHILERHFEKHDPVIFRLIKRTGPIGLKRNKHSFQSLCRAIVSQQISTRAAQTIHNRFRALFSNRYPNPLKMQEISEKELRNAGLSRQKIVYLKDLSLKFRNKTIRPRRFQHQSNEEIIRSLTSVKGIGRWTAEMFLMFSLNRLDVLPIDDLGLQKAIMNLYSLKAMPKREDIMKYGKHWKPYQSVAVWYCWRSLD